MRILLTILLVLGLGACAGNKSEKQQGPDENVPNQTSSEDKNAQEKGNTGEQVEDVDGEKSPEEVLEKAKGQIASEFDVKLPNKIDVSNGKFLSATVDSDAFYYEAAFFETDEPAAVNDAKLTEEEPMMIVKGTIYDSEEEAHEQTASPGRGRKLFMKCIWPIHFG